MNDMSDMQMGEAQVAPWWKRAWWIRARRIAADTHGGATHELYVPIWAKPLNAIHCRLYGNPLPLLDSDER